MYWNNEEIYFNCWILAWNVEDCSNNFNKRENLNIVFVWHIRGIKNEEEKSLLQYFSFFDGRKKKIDI